MIPHARLQPNAPMSMVRTSSRPAPATLKEQVKVRTMIKANRTSVILSIGSRIRLGGCSKSANMVVERPIAAIHPPVGWRVAPEPDALYVEPVPSRVGRQNNGYRCRELPGNLSHHPDTADLTA